MNGEFHFTPSIGVSETAGTASIETTFKSTNANYAEEKQANMQGEALLTEVYASDNVPV